MDPLTHTLAGATIAWTVAGRQLGRRALLLGGVAALLPDLDVMIRSADDPLLMIEHHRGFTHSLAVAIPAGAGAALPFVGGRERRAWPLAMAGGALAWTSHAILDAATTYGTQLFWPFSRMRVGLDIISIIDPIFTLLFVVALIAALRSRRAVVAACLASAVLWLAIGGVQRERAMRAQRQLAASRGEVVTRGAVFPTIGNTVVWRSIYETGGVLRMDRVRVVWLRPPAFTETASVPRLSRPPSADGRIRTDFERFAWFSDHWVARDPADPTIIGDARYSLRATRWEPVWGIRFHPDRIPPTEWVDRSRERDLGFQPPIGPVRSRG
ncbi:MAG TPA: metal-dependent hydrolase [Thermoanaerobaculia bacterium]|nr:metal-dependent hydrolase [Thermoanaerobaculia bacterium]